MCTDEKKQLSLKYKQTLAAACQMYLNICFLSYVLNPKPNQGFDLIK